MTQIVDLIGELEEEKRIFEDMWAEIQQTWNDLTQKRFEKTIDWYVHDLDSLIRSLRQIDQQERE